MVALHAVQVVRDELLETGHLSTDYLNRYNEALMLIEMASMDPTIVEDLAAWRPLGYVAHFENAGLRCGPGAIAAYQCLTPLSRQAFEHLCSGMDRLVMSVVNALNALKAPEDAVFVVDIAVSSFKSLLSRATAFINTGGDLASVAFDESELQSTVDQLIG
ncbi:MAG: hypothetical protein ACRCWO_07250 [Bosea sp. (in: a-proteobacteria)]